MYHDNYLLHLCGQAYSVLILSILERPLETVYCIFCGQAYSVLILSILVRPLETV